MPPAPPTKTKRFGFVALGVSGIVGLVLGAAMFAGGDTATTAAAPAAEPAPTVTVTETAPAPEAEPEAEPEPDPEPEGPDPATYEPKKSDWKVKVKETGKQCFGSAGCNVELTIQPEFNGDASTVPDTGTIEVTYEITGAEDPLIDTFSVTGGEVSWTKTQNVQTSSKSSKLKAKITDATYTEY